jgi:hypothetical protein
VADIGISSAADVRFGDRLVVGGASFVSDSRCDCTASSIVFTRDVVYSNPLSV